MMETSPRVLIACEFSGVVRRAFRKQGFDAWSCDILPSEDGGPHLRGNVLDIIDGYEGKPWAGMIAFPPCTDLVSSGARWFTYKTVKQEAALTFFRTLLDAPIPHVAVENPIGIPSTRIRPPDQIIQPWQFGVSETKATCLWLRGFPRLRPTHIVRGYNFEQLQYFPNPYPRVHREPPSPDRWKNRSRTLEPIAEAMATQWGPLLR